MLARAPCRVIAPVARRVVITLYNSRSYARSSSKKQETQPSKILKTTLPKHKLRSLISLYHQTSTFITPENLSATIDSAFASGGRSDVTYFNYRDLSRQLARRREGPKYVWPRAGAGASSSGSMFEAPVVMRNPFEERNKLLTGGLWGVDVQRKPTLETLEEKFLEGEEERKMFTENFIKERNITPEQLEEQKKRASEGGEEERLRHEDPHSRRVLDLLRTPEH